MSERPTIRPAEDGDIEAVKNLFTSAYGESYPFKQFYDTAWLKKAVYDDDTLFLAAEQGGKVLGTVSALFTAGGLSDLIGEFGRLVTDPAARGHGLGAALFKDAVDRTADALRFGFAEGRTAHIGSQKILEREGFVPLGFEPLKYKLGARESVVLYGRLFGAGDDLRRNHPRVIPEAAALARAALARAGLAEDVIVVDDEDGYPRAAAGDLAATEGEIEIEDLSARGWSPLLRIERGRVKGREVFGNLSLSHGFFKIKNAGTRYLVAREKGAMLGGLGFTQDPIDRKIRIFELIGFDDAVKGRLLREAERVAREAADCVYIEIDVSAYAPALQRTLERMGFMAVAYCPSMVFEDVERLDVLRMAKLAIPYFREEIPLTEGAAEMRELVEQSMAERRGGNSIAAVAADTSLFRGLEEGDVYHLARIGRIRRVASGQRLIGRGERGDRLFVLLAGSLRVERDGRAVAHTRPGCVCGEMALLDDGPRSADVTAEAPSEVVEFMEADLARLMAARPALGATVMRNLAAGLAAKLRQPDAGCRRPTPCLSRRAACDTIRP